MNSSHRAVAAIALVFVPALPAAAADHSRLGEVTAIVDPGDCLLEVAVARQRPRGHPRSQLSTLQLGCGIGAGTEVELQAALLRAGDLRERELVLEARTQLHESGRFATSLAYGVTAERGARRRLKRSSHFVAAEWTYSFPDAWVVEARLGSERDRADARHYTFWGLAVEYAAAEAIELRLEVDGIQSQRARWGLALRWIAWPDRAYVTLGHGVVGGVRGERTTGLAITYEF